MIPARSIVYAVGLLHVLAAARLLLREASPEDGIGAGVAFAIILLLVGLAVMVSANYLDAPRTRDARRGGAT